MLSDSELVDPPDGSDFMQRPCPIPWCKATKKVRLPPGGKHDTTERYSYGECRDGLGPFAGLVHVGRLSAVEEDDDD